MSSKTVTVNPWHWLEDDGSLPTDTRLRGRVLRVAQFIEYGGTLARGHGRQTLVACKRRPGGTSCGGLMCVVKMSDDAIIAFCSTCEAEEFLIYEWQNTAWARGQQPPIDPVVELGESLGEPLDASPERSDSRAQDEQLRGALASVGSGLRVAEVRELVVTVDSPVELIEAVVGSCASAPDIGAMRRLLPILTDVWNDTPRPEFVGRSPAEIHAASSGRQVGRNARCPCGSGREYQRCCGAH